MTLTRRTVLLATILPVALPLMAADVSGKWNFDVSLDMGGGSPVFEFEQNGETLSGTFSGAAGEAKLNGTVKGNEIQFEFETEFGTIKYEGAIKDAGNMEGKADYAGQASGTWTAKRAE